MKKFSKILSVALLVALVLSLGITSAFAEETVVNTQLGSNTTFTITVSKDPSDKAAHTYGAFQVFKGDLAETFEGDTLKSKVLSNIQWGDSIDSSKVAALINELNGILGTSLATDASAADVAKAIGDKGYNFDEAGAQAVADAFDKALKTDPVASQNTPNDAGKYVITVPAGYYLVKDTAPVTGEGAQTRFILQVVSNVEPVEKANVPSIEKKVKEKNDSAAASGTNPTDWQDAADYDIGDFIPYKITGTLPGKFAEYDTYKTYTIIDKLSAGLTPPTADKINVTLNAVDGTDISGFFDISVDGQQIKVSLKSGVDMKTAKIDDALVFSANSKIIVTYEAQLNTNAVIGSGGNDNTVYLEYSNNPNYDGEGKGKTPEDKVVVFTYEIKALKVEPDGALVDEIPAGADPNDYVKVGNKWQKTTPLTGAGFTLFKKDASKTAATQESFSVAKTKGDVVKDGDDFYVAVADEIKNTTTFEFKGQDAGVYKLVETTVPAGFNKADDIDITVTATYDTESADPKLTSLTVTPATAGFTVSVTENKDDSGSVTSITTDGVISGKVVNNHGTVLPSTGGIGTTIFYAVGGILVLAAIVLLITKKRMSD